MAGEDLAEAETFASCSESHLGEVQQILISRCSSNPAASTGQSVSNASHMKVAHTAGLARASPRRGAFSSSGSRRHRAARDPHQKKKPPPVAPRARPRLAHLRLHRGRAQCPCRAYIAYGPGGRRKLTSTEVDHIGPGLYATTVNSPLSRSFTATSLSGFRLFINSATQSRCLSGRDSCAACRRPRFQIERLCASSSSSASRLWGAANSGRPRGGHSGA